MGHLKKFPSAIPLMFDSKYSLSDGNYANSGEDIETLKSIIQEQDEKITSLEKDLIKYQEITNNQSHTFDIYDDDNQNVFEFLLIF